jgi:hypothetical protein
LINLILASAYISAPVVGGIAGGVAPSYCSCEYRTCRGVRRVNVRCPYGSGRPYWLALSSFHPPTTSIAADFRGVALVAIRLTHLNSFQATSVLGLGRPARNNNETGLHDGLPFIQSILFNQFYSIRGTV